MKFLFLAACASVFATSGAGAAVTSYTNSSEFFAQNPGVVLIEDFENSDTNLRDTPLPSYIGPNGAITFTAISSYPFTAESIYPLNSPNVMLVSPSYAPYWTGPTPPDSIALATYGNEDWFGSLTNPSTALGFDVHLNDSPLTISFFSGSTLLTTLNFAARPDPESHLAFAGIASSSPITGFHWTAIRGEVFHTGIDNIYAVPASGVPEPASWLTMLLGFAGIGFVKRGSSRSRGSTQVPKSFRSKQRILNPI